MRPEPATRFLRALWGDRPPGLVQVWQLAQRRSTYLRRPAGGEAFCGMSDVYTGVALAATDRGPHRRCRASEAAAIAGVWADIDVNGGPERKTGAAPDMAQAIALATDLAQPSILVDSGYGLQAWWLFDRPWKLGTLDERSEAATLAARWQDTLRKRAREWGFGLDATHDLARLMRLPGTVNGKGGLAAPVSIVALDERQRHPRAAIEALAQGSDARVQVPASEPDLPVLDVTGDGRHALDEHKLDALIANSAEFERTWMHARKEQWSMSEYDLALCSIAAGAGWSDHELCALITLHRRLRDPGGRKGQRADYLRRTVQRARQRSDLDAHLDWFKQQASRTAPVDEHADWFSRRAKDAA